MLQEGFLKKHMQMYKDEPLKLFFFEVVTTPSTLEKIKEKKVLTDNVSKVQETKSAGESLHTNNLSDDHGENTNKSIRGTIGEKRKKAV